MSKKLKVILYILIAVLVLYFMPFITVLKQDGNGNTWRVPFGSSFDSISDESVTFKNIRSKYANEKDADNALHSYEEVKCYGEKYYFDHLNNVTITGLDVEGGMPSKVTYHFEHGNYCEGWTMDDEVAFEFGPIEDVDLNISVEDALKKEWFVVKDGKAVNPAAYNDFARMVKQGVYCMERMIVINGDERSIVDMQVVEEGDKPFKVTTRTKDGVEVEHYSRFTDVIENGKKVVQVYYAQSSDEKPTVLFEFEE